MPDLALLAVTKATLLTKSTLFQVNDNILLCLAPVDSTKKQTSYSHFCFMFLSNKVAFSLVIDLTCTFC